MSEMADEVVAEVVEEKVPEIKWRNTVIQWVQADGENITCGAKDEEHLCKMVAYCERDREPYRILRVQPPNPPKKQRVSIEWDAVERVRYDAVAIMPKDDLLGCMGPIPEQLRRLVERHASIVTEEVQP